MLKRKFYDTLLSWKENKHQQCLLVKGARKVGKTYIIDYFGKTNYKSYFYLNFIDHPEYKEIFSEALDGKTVYTKMALILGVSLDEFIEGNTLIFLDEIQECPNARTALKFLAIDDRYDVIASGALLSLNLKGIASIPVGYEKQVTLYSLDFEEFMWASGYGESETNLVRDYYNGTKHLDSGTNKVLLDQYKLYLVVGGLPSVVSLYFDTRDFIKVHEAQEEIIKLYEDDIRKFSLPRKTKERVMKCFHCIPTQLIKDNTKFQYKKVSPDGNGRMYSYPLYWLNEAGIISISYNVLKPELPLIGYTKNEEFKVYLNDTGLLTCMLGLDSQRQLYFDSLKGNARGGIYENAIAETLTKKGDKLYYYKKEGSTQEIDFLLEREGDILPVEVKSRQGKDISLDNYINTYKPHVAYKLIKGNANIDTTKKTLPLFMGIYL